MSMWDIVKIRMSWELGNLLSAVALYAILLGVIVAGIGIYLSVNYVKEKWLGWEWHRGRTLNGPYSMLIPPTDRRHSKYRSE